MKISEFRKLIREEIRKVISENSIDTTNVKDLQSWIASMSNKLSKGEIASLNAISTFLKTNPKNIVIIPSYGRTKELFDTLYNYYEGPKYKSSFKDAPGQTSTIDSEGTMHYSKPANVFYWDYVDEYFYIMRKDTLAAVNV